MTVFGIHASHGTTPVGHDGDVRVELPEFGCRWFRVTR